MRLYALILLFSWSASAQITADGITANVSRTVNITADEADFSVTVTCPLDTTQQQVIQILVNAGIPNPSVVSVAAGQNFAAYPPVNATQIFYQIAFGAAPSAMIDLAKKLDALNANLPAALAGLQYVAALNASQTAVNAAHQSVLAQLLADARSEAQILAAAASLTVGKILGIGESSYGTPGLVSTISMNSTQATNSTTSGTQYVFYANVKFAAQ